MSFAMDTILTLLFTLLFMYVCLVLNSSTFTRYKCLVGSEFKIACYAYDGFEQTENETRVYEFHGKLLL